MFYKPKFLLVTATLFTVIFSFASVSNATHADYTSIYSNYQFPSTRTTTVRHTLRIALPEDIAATKTLLVNAPTSFKVNENVVVFDDNNQPVMAQVKVVGQQISLTFTEPLAPGTRLNLDINNVQIWGTTRTYRVIARAIDGESTFLGTTTIRSY
jgi:hypothetical protein